MISFFAGLCFLFKKFVFFVFERAGILLDRKVLGMGCRAQISMEFIITIILMLFVFSFGVFIFEQKTLLNNESSQKWAAQDTAYRVARNIDSAYFLDGNAAITDYIYWAGGNKSIAVASRVVRVGWGSGSMVTAPLVAPAVVWNVSEMDGAIVFRNVDGNVVVDYP